VRNFGLGETANCVTATSFFPSQCVINSAEEVMCSSAFVCLFVCLFCPAVV